MSRLTPFLWYDTQAEDAANLYVSVFPGSRILRTSRYGEAGPGPAGSVMTVEFELDGQRFLALNGGPHFRFSEAVSFLWACETQEELDGIWDRLLEGGTPLQCGWLKDRFGLAWQIVPAALNRMLADPDPARSQRVVQAMMPMVKIDLATLLRAYEGQGPGKPGIPPC